MIDSIKKLPKVSLNVNFRWEVTFQPMGGNEGKYRERKVVGVNVNSMTLYTLLYNGYQ